MRPSRALRRLTIYEPVKVHDQFLFLLKRGDVVHLEELIESGRFIKDINYIYVLEDGKEFNAFQVICTELFDTFALSGTDITIVDSLINCAKFLLDHGIDITYADPDYKGEAIDYAVVSGFVDIVEHTIKKYKEQGVSFKYKDLFSTIIYLHDSKRNINAKYLPIAELLIDNDVDVNAFDVDTGEPAIYRATQQKMANLIELLVRKKPYVLDLDFYQDRNNKTARKLISMYNLYEGRLPQVHVLNFSNIYISMQESDATEFINEFKMNKADLSLDDCVSLLFRAANFGKEEIVEYILSQIPDEKAHLSLLLSITCKRGYYRVLEMLLEETSVDYGIEIIEEIVEMENVVDEAKYKNVDWCLKILLENKRLNLNLLNRNGKCLLELAMVHKSEDFVLTLLEHGATLTKYDDHYTKIDCLATEIEPEILKKHFDSCITTTMKQSHYTKFRMRSPKSKSSFMEISVSDYNVNFTSLLAPKFRHKTVNVTELEATRKAFASNIYIEEMTVFKNISINPKYNHLLVHPVALVFVSMKAQKVRWFFYMDMIFYVVYAILLNAFVFSMHSRIIFILLIIVMIVTEVWHVFQLAVLGKTYLMIFENWYKFFLTFLTMAMLPTHYLDEDPLPWAGTEWRLQLSAVTCLVSITNLFLVTGHLRCAAISVIMIKSIYRAIFVTITYYFVLILAFSTSFYLFLRETKSEYFQYYFLALFKTILMASGETDATNKGYSPFPDMSYIVLVLFLILIGMGVVSLLAGLSVSNTKSIRQNAEILGAVQMVSRISRIENLLFKKSLKNSFNRLRAAICLYSLFSYDNIVEIDKINMRVHVHDPDHYDMPINKEIVAKMDKRAKRKGGWT